MARGRVSAEAAAAITGVLNALPDTATADERTRAEALLVAQAATLDPAELALCGQALKEALTVTPDVDDPAEAERVAKELADAEAREASEWERRAVRLTRRRDGMLGITGALDALSGALVREMLEAAARPVDAVARGYRDPREPEQRLADALVELITTTGPLDLDEDPGMTPRPDHDRDDGTPTTPATRTPDDAGRRPDADDLDDPDDADDRRTPTDDLDDAGRPGRRGRPRRPRRRRRPTTPVTLEDPVLDFGGRRCRRGDPVLDFGGRRVTGGCCAGANRAHRRAHRCGTGRGTGTGRSSRPPPGPG